MLAGLDFFLRPDWRQIAGQYHILLVPAKSPMCEEGKDVNGIVYCISF